MQYSYHTHPPYRQTGSTLIVSLIMLIILMLLGVTSMITSDTQYKLAGNLQFEDLAMNRAEAALSEAETWLRTGTNYKSAGFTTATCDARNPNHLYPLDAGSSVPCISTYTAPANDPQTMAWDSSNSVTATTEGAPRYMIELTSTNDILIGSSADFGGDSSSGCNKVNTYRITARGSSARGATKFVRSYYSVLSC
jgi:type IV pilus assembly protein PilX